MPVPARLNKNTAAVKTSEMAEDQWRVVVDEVIDGATVVVDDAFDGAGLFHALAWAAMMAASWA